MYIYDSGVLDSVQRCGVEVILTNGAGWKSVTRKLVSHWLKLVSGRVMVLGLIIGHLYDLRAKVLMVYGLNVLINNESSKAELAWSCLEAGLYCRKFS